MTPREIQTLARELLAKSDPTNKTGAEDFYNWLMSGTNREGAEHLEQLREILWFVVEG